MESIWLEYSPILKNPRRCDRSGHNSSFSSSYSRRETNNVWKTKSGNSDRIFRFLLSSLFIIRQGSPSADRTKFENKKEKSEQYKLHLSPRSWKRNLWPNPSPYYFYLCSHWKCNSKSDLRINDELKPATI